MTLAQTHAIVGKTSRAEVASPILCLQVTTMADGNCGQPKWSRHHVHECRRRFDLRFGRTLAVDFRSARQGSIHDALVRVALTRRGLCSAPWQRVLSEDTSGRCRALLVSFTAATSAVVLRG